MNFTIFGYPKTGKTTLFNLLTGAKIEVRSFDDGKKEPNLRTCSIPDHRLEQLSTLYPDKQKKPAQIDYIDLAGISFGQVKNETYISFLRKADGLAHVVRGFHDPQIPHPKDKISPQDDIQSMDDEMVLTDLISVESRLEKLETELKRGKTPENQKEKDLLVQLHQTLQEGKAIREVSLSSDQEKLMRSFAFLSQKPLFHLINLDEKDIPLLNTPEKIYAPEKKLTSVLAFCGNIETEILEFEENDKTLFMQEYGMEELSASKFLKASYDLLDVITFFTIGKEEVKAWTIKKETSALDAAGIIHTDIQKGFVRAEVIASEELLQHGSFQTARESASVRLEGKDYMVQDGDVIYFRFAK